MITTDLLQRAVSAIYSRDPETGYGLTELLRTGSILPPDNQNEKDLHFFFEGEKVLINRESIFSHGTESIEERLIIKYGELAEKYKLQTGETDIDFISAAKRIHKAGIERLVNFEIKRAVEDIRKAGSSLPIKKRQPAETVIDILKGLKPFSDNLIKIEKHEILYSAEVSPGRTIHFIPFPFSFNSLKQAAELQLEYFHVRFLICTLISGISDMLYAAVTGGIITGIILLDKRYRHMSQVIEVKYIATVNSKPEVPETAMYPRIKGTGTFIIAGTWLLWKEIWSRAHEIYLNAESGAADFYRSIGFSYRHPYGYLLKTPEGKLLLYITVMTMNLSGMSQNLEKAMKKIIRAQFRHLKNHHRTDDIKRKAAVLFVTICIGPGKNTLLKATAKNLLHKYSGKIPESTMLLEGLKEEGTIRTTPVILNGAGQIPVVWDALFEEHLKGVFHLESSKRIPAVRKILSADSLFDRITIIPPRQASFDELLWCHKKEYIEKVAKTSGIKISSLDTDTQTTAQTYVTAKLAAGGIFSLIDTLYSQEAGSQGIAFIRPPGHHAEPDRAMGFCIFNNVALGAEYALKHYNAERVLIVDIDLHHGNGTQKIFYDRKDVLYFSAHQFPCFPGTGKLGETGNGEGMGYTVNVPLHMGLSDLDYQKVFHFMLCPIAEEYRPDIIMVSLGFDLFHDDPLGKMNVSPEGYALMTRMLKELAGELCKGKIMFVMEGGYSIKGIKKCGSRVIQELAGIPTLPPDKIERVKKENPENLLGLKKAIEVHKEYWKCLKVQ